MSKARPRAMMIEMDDDARALMDRVREALVQRNEQRILSGDFSYERTTYKSIVQRGIAAVAREILSDSNDI